MRAKAAGTLLLSDVRRIWECLKVGVRLPRGKDTGFGNRNREITRLAQAINSLRRAWHHLLFLEVILH